MSRNQQYYLLNDKLSKLSDNEIIKIIEKRDNMNIILIYDTKLLIKIIPIANKYINRKMETKNIYNLPNYYNYGFVNIEVNPWRELILNIKTTNLVLIEKCNFFPLLYFYKVIKIKKPIDLKNIYVNDKYLQDKLKSKIYLIMFMEYIPVLTIDYLKKNSDFIEDFYNKSKKIIKFLNKNKIIHNNPIINNFLIDKNKKIYLTNFNLSLFKEFKLNNDEKNFMKNNKDIDNFYIKDNILFCYLNKTYNNDKINKKYQIHLLTSLLEISNYVIEYIEKIKDDINLSEFEYKFIKKYKKELLKFVKFKKDFKKYDNKLNYNIKNNL